MNQVAFIYLIKTHTHADIQTHKHTPSMHLHAKTKKKIHVFEREQGGSST